MKKILVLSMLLSSSLFAATSIEKEPKELSAEEEKLAYELLALMRTTANMSQSKSEDKVMRRDAHPKAHGCVKAEFTVREDLPEDLRVGLFANVGQTYPTWVRFSNANFAVQDDKTADARGMALKIMNVPGDKLHGNFFDHDSVDFNLVSAQVFPFRNLKEFRDFMKSLANTGTPFSYFLPGVKFWEWKPLALAELLKGRLHKTASVRTENYNSLLPFSFGEGRAVRYRTTPCTRLNDSIPANAGPNFLREGLVSTLAKEELCFNFAVQFHKQGMDLDDALTRWSESASPWISVAQVKVPVQTFDTAEQNQFCENLSFNPWRTLSEHRPMGSLNRARRVLYKLQSEYRRDFNGFPSIEPQEFN